MNPDLGMTLKAQYSEGTFFSFEDFTIRMITFNNEEFISVIADVISDDFTFIASFDFSLNDFMSFAGQLRGIPFFDKIIKNTESWFHTSKGTTNICNLDDIYRFKNGEVIYGFLGKNDIDDNNQAFAPFQSYELFKIDNPNIFRKEERPLFIIAREICNLMIYEKVDIPQLIPYLNAMLSLNTIDQQYNSDSGESIVSYFIANSMTWKGSIEFSKLKKELYEILKNKDK